MHDINYFHEHELKEHDFLGCCKDCRTSLNIIKPHILAFAERIRKYTRKMLEEFSQDKLYRLYQISDDLAHLDAGEHLAGLILEEEAIRSVLPVIRSYYSTFFSMHEEHLEKQLLGSNNPWETLKTFPLYPRYEALVKSQVEAMPVAPGIRLAGGFWPSACAVRDLCGPAMVPGDHLQSSQLDICGQHQGLSSDPAKLQRYGTVTEDGFCQTINLRCASIVIPAYSRTRLSYRRSKNHAQCTTDAILALFF